MKPLARAYHTFAFAWLASKAAVLLINAVTFPRLRSRPTPQTGPRVSILIPARDEAANLPHTLPGVLAQGADEVIVLDDSSTDGTAEIASGLGARVVRGQPLPPGWFGKPWACQQLSILASGDILIFTDADVTWHAGALGAVLHELEASGADLLSVQPRQSNRTLGERLLTPLVDAAVLSYFPYPAIRQPQAAATIANGQVMAFRRVALEGAGGYALVRRELLEDMQLARRLKARGGRVASALGQNAIGVRMYRSYPDSVRGFSKNVLPIHLHSRPLLLLSAVAHLAVYTLPWLLPVLRRPVPGARALRVLGLLERTAVALIAGRRSPADLLEGLLGPVTPLLALPVYLRAARRRVVWKGREYPQGEGGKD
ncbi:glycosyltransferase [Deinococcus marmoris]|uniref:Glycosyl transferase, family 2 n=1 Tax=Deinococcus marmoris TaxID=249408 RepID=A0A1U7NS88_9DEIO|nr:glycosyltransferase family 2 protein [Deinococcus marmoris]OLV15780.1 Glycosyl transferase, family 2 [Deinococcus marmoris]